MYVCITKQHRTTTATRIVIVTVTVAMQNKATKRKKERKNEMGVRFNAALAGH